MRIRDWSSDVCSSDLAGERDFGACRGSIGDRDENGIHDLLRVCFGQAVIGGDRLGEVGVVHSILLIGFMTGESISELDATNVADKAAMSARDRTSTRLNSSHYCASSMPPSSCKKKNTHMIT